MNIENPINQGFVFSTENEAKIQEIFKKYPVKQKKSAILPLLDLAQRQNNGWLSDETLKTVADKIDMPKIYVLEVASFYSMFHLKPVGKHVIEVCQTLSCKLRGAEKIKKILQEKLSINMHETTSDNLFTLLPCECLGACINAPIVKIDDDYYEDLELSDLDGIIDKIKAGQKPKIGSYKNRISSEPIQA